MSEHANHEDMIEKRRTELQLTLQPGGVLHEIATAAIVEKVELSPDDIANIILPPKQPGDKYEARWELIAAAPATIKTTADACQEKVIAMAQSLALLRSESLPQEDLGRIDPELALWMVEGGANRTSVVRRQLAIEAMRQVYGENLKSYVVHQFGSDRLIPKEREDKQKGEIVPNAEYKIAAEIAGDFLPETDDLTEFELNLASARQAGFEIMSDLPGVEETVVKRVVQLTKADSPLLVLVNPANQGNGLKDGFTAAAEVANPPEGFQPVIITNGQYRAKDELQAKDWAKEEGISILPVVALGDEPGFTVNHNGKEITTAPRGPMIYVNEAVVLHRLYK